MKTCARTQGSRKRSIACSESREARADLSVDRDPGARDRAAVGGTTGRSGPRTDDGTGTAANTDAGAGAGAGTRIADAYAYAYAYA